MNSRHTGYLFCGLAMIGVGSTVVVSREIAVGLAPFSATALRFAIAFPLFLAIMRLRGVRWPRLDLRDALLVFAQAGAGSVGYTVLLISGMKLASAADAGVIAGTLPAVSALVAVVALGERMSAALAGAVALATAGVLVCTVPLPALSAAGTSWITVGNERAPEALAGNALVFAAVVCEALFILINRKLRATVTPLQLSALMSGIGFCVAIVPALFEAPWRGVFDAPAVMGVVYYALVPTVAGFMLWYAGSERVTGGEASVTTALVPVSSLVFAALLLHETIRPAQLAGMACVLGAILLATVGRARLRSTAQGTTSGGTPLHAAPREARD